MTKTRDHVAEPAGASQDEFAVESRDRLRARLDGRAGTRRRLEIVSIGQGDGLDALLGGAPAEPATDPIPALVMAARIHGAELFRLDAGVYAFLASADDLPGSPAATAGAAIAGDGEAQIVFGEALLPDEARTAEEAMALAIARHRIRAGLRHGSVERQVRAALLQVLRERGTGATPGVAADAVAVGRRMGLDLARLDLLLRAAELQNIGKLSIPEGILAKRGPLTDAEWELVRQHPVAGERILKASPAMAAVARIVRSCSESFDGSGYPDGLRQQEIPLESRIIAVCVAFDAMTSQRPYRSPRSVPAALGELRSLAGIQFDPVVVARFCDVRLHETSSSRRG